MPVRLITSTIVTILLFAAACSSCRRADGSDRIERRVAHVSIDDVEVFGDLIRHRNDYDSLFQHPFFGYLKELHRKYGIAVTLYTYEYPGNDSLRLEDMPLKFKNDFKEASDWLRIGYHSRSADFDSLITVDEFRNSYNKVNSAIARFADSTMIASTLRFHYFFAPDSILSALRGVGTLLCADRDGGSPSYDLTEPEATRVKAGRGIMKNGVSYRKTDFRIDDNIRGVGRLRGLKGSDTLVVFAHEWKIWNDPEKAIGRSAAGRVKAWTSERINRELFEMTVGWLDKAGYKFSFLE